MGIGKVSHISNTDATIFHKNIIDTISLFQEAGLKVEIQYQANTVNDFQTVFSALLIGRN